MKTVLITGSEGQLGVCYIAKLLELGYDIIAFDIVETTKNNNITYMQVDITSSAEIKAAVDKIDKNIDILINNAGAAVFSPFEDRTEEEIDYVMDVNIKGAVVLTQLIFNKYFKPNKTGCIVNIGSIYGVVSGDMNIYQEADRRTSEIYGATKAAIIQLTKYFSTYMAPYHVRVNCISPGGIFNHQSPDFIDAYSKKVPMGRMGREEELLSTLEYLISEDSTYVTGQNIIVDGGFTDW